MAGKNIIMSRGVPVQKNDPAILQTLSDKAVTRLVNGKITDYNGSNIDPYEFTWADFINLNSADYAGTQHRQPVIRQILIIVIFISELMATKSSAFSVESTETMKRIQLMC